MSCGPRDSELPRSLPARLETGRTDPGRGNRVMQSAEESASCPTYRKGAAMNTIQVDEQDAVAAVVERGRPGSPLARYIKVAMKQETYQQSAVDQPWHGAI